MSSIIGVIADSRLAAHIFQFVPSSTLLEVNHDFNKNVHFTVSPILVRKCLDFLNQNQETFPFLFNQFCNNNCLKNSSDPHKTLFNSIKSFAKTNGNTVKSEEFFDPISLLRQIQQEDLSLIAFYRVLREARIIPKDEVLLTSAAKIRDWMLRNRDKFSAIRNLNLSNKELETIPKEINHFNNLIILNLSNNRIKQFPAEIQCLSKLTTIEFSNNQISLLHKNCSLLNNLETISCHNNEITEFPKMLSSIPQLQKLNLAFNHIRDISVEKNDFPMLQELDVSFNKIRQLPQALLNRKNLTIDNRGNCKTLKKKKVQMLRSSVDGKTRVPSPKAPELDLSSNERKDPSPKIRKDPSPKTGKPKGG